VLDIEVVIKRTTAYALVLGVVIALYALVVGSVSAAVGSSSRIRRRGGCRHRDSVRARPQAGCSTWLTAASSAFSMIRRTGRSVLEAIEAAVEESQLGEIVVRRMDEVIPVECIALIAAEPGTGGCAFSVKRGGGGWERREPLPLHREADEPPGRRRGHRSGGPSQRDPGDLAARLKIVAVFPIRREPESPWMHRSWGQALRARFTAEDVDLLMQVAAESGLALQRIRLLRQLLLEQLTARRLES